ncbi:hypothetical protein HZS_5296 [Henneguya salminicola]|nr:hypothetical protein HZS_5296 [Henneguya salminicola]
MTSWLGDIKKYLQEAEELIDKSISKAKNCSISLVKFLGLQDKKPKKNKDHDHLSLKELLETANNKSTHHHKSKEHVKSHRPSKEQAVPKPITPVPSRIIFRFNV